MFCAIRERLLLIKVHQQRRALKGIQPNIDKLLLIGKWRHVRAPALSPIAHGRNVYAIQIGVPVVSLSRLSDELAPVLEIQKIAKIRLPDFSVLVRRFVGTPRARVPIPSRQRILVRVWH